ncbi:MAG: hypothetical protein RMI94_05870 [Bryobacterales bacterium]|nr:hypothetical protein [Bryobacteraceae bacterium]MDW8130057.1 hypothetical protein [Bryobacterales bacterium]
MDRAQEGLVAVYSPDRHLLAFWPAAEVERNGNFWIVRTRKGRIVRAYLRDDDPALILRLIEERKRSDYGAGFQQKLDCGRLCWALKGVRGSH